MGAAAVGSELKPARRSMCVLWKSRRIHIWIGRRGEDGIERVQGKEVREAYVMFQL